MPTTTPALIADSATSGFRQGSIERRDLRPDDIRIDIAFAGICHSDTVSYTHLRAHET